MVSTITITRSLKPELFFLKQRLFRRHALSYYTELARNQYRSEEELSVLSWEKRVRLLQHAYTTVPFYKRSFDKIGLIPSDIRTPDDWKHVPLVTRSDLVECFEQFVSSRAEPGRLAVSATGGSTGNPVKVYHDRRYPADTLGWRMLGWWGIEPGTDAAYAWRLVRATRLSRALNAAMWWPTKRIWLDASSITEADMSAFVKKFNRLKPPLLQGYVGAIHSLASFVAHNSIQMHRPSAIWVTSSPITKGQRVVIEEAFGAPVYDQYGCGEVFWLAAQCKVQDGLHVFSDARHIEFVDEKGNSVGNGDFGRVTITDLENEVFPLIRYQNGDRGRSRSGCCPCGVRLPLMDPVKGRVSDMVKLPDGTLLSGDYLTTVFDSFPEAISAFQVLQRTDYSITVKVVENRQYGDTSKVFDAVRETLEAKTKGQIPLHFQAVAEIPSDRGKNRFVISEVQASCESP